MSVSFVEVPKCERARQGRALRSDEKQLILLGEKRSGAYLADPP